MRIYIQKDLRPLEARQAGVKTVAEALVRLTAQYKRVPTLDPHSDMKVCERYPILPCLPSY